jgi:hypothetical protein
MTDYNVPSPVKGSNVSVATTITGRERIFAVRLGVGTSIAKTIAIPVSLLDAYVSST